MASARSFSRAAVLTGSLVSLWVLVAGCGDDGFLCGPGTMAVDNVCLPVEEDARRPTPPDGGADLGPVIPPPDLGPPPPPPPDLGPPDLDMGPPPPPPPDLGPPPPPDTGPPPPVDMGPPEMDMGPPDSGPMDSGPMDSGPTDSGPTDSGPTDSGPTDSGPGADAGPAITTPVRLLISRVVVGRDVREAVEVYNPNAFPVDLSRYYITDAAAYGSLPNGTAPPASDRDYLMRFPDGAVIGPRDFVVVSLRTAAGLSAEIPGAAVDYDLFGTGASPRMVNLVAGSVLAPNPPYLGNDSEWVVLFYWDGVSDLVIDVDFVEWSTGAAVAPPNKTGLAVDGPDPGAVPSTYGTDTLPPNTVSPGFEPATPRDHFLVRCDYTESTEARRADANGVTAAGLREDETSEPIASTWRAILDMGTAAFALGTVPTATVCPGGPIGI